MRIFPSHWQGLNESLATDPRLSRAQRESLAAAARADLVAECEGLDRKLRPVVKAQLHGAQRRYSLLRNGDPVPVDGRIVEAW